MKAVTVRRSPPSASFQISLRWIAFVALIVGSWLLWDVIQRPIVSTLVTLTGGQTPTTGSALTLHRYAVIGISRTLWWLSITMLGARIVSYNVTELAWRGRMSLTDLGWGLVAGTVAMAVVIGLLVAAGAGRLLAPAVPIARWAPEASLWLGAELLIAMAEELLFRVALFAILRAWIGRWPALLLSAVLFSIAHGDSLSHPIFGIQVLVAGIVFAVAIQRSCSVWWPVGLHAGWNWTCATVFGAANSGVANEGQILRLAPRGPAWLDGGAVGPEGSVFAFIGWGVGLLIILWWTRTHPSEDRS